MGAYRTRKQTLRRKLALHRVRLAVLERRLRLALLDGGRRSAVERARERMESAIDEAPTAELEALILAYDEALVGALEATDARQRQRSRLVWQVFTATTVVAMAAAVVVASL